MAPVPPSLSSLHAHSIFVPSNTSSKGDNEKWEILDGPYDLSVPLKKQRIVTRDKDIIVAHGNEIRMASLAGDGWDVIDGSIGTYRVSRPGVSWFKLMYRRLRRLNLDSKCRVW